jgi:sterol desaturase/sphingolipid hydroxylase (fatty acid hydroxylase superfamily)
VVNPIAIAIPLFFVAIGVEFAVARRRGVRVYRFADTVTDLSCGILQQVTVQWLVVLHGPYVWLWGLAWHPNLPTAAQHLVAFLGVDLVYYLWHRFTHESNLGWWSHVVHHQSEDYNLAVALRQSVSSAVTSWPFQLPLVFLGVPPEVVLLHSALNTLYQFWIHTELVPALGPLEYVINTPSAHRVHHAVNPGYLDKNYAGVLIVWDRWFGTYAPETEPCVYGTVERFQSTNPVAANWWWLGQVLSDARSAVAVGRWADAARVLVAPPAWRPAHLPPHPAPAVVHPRDVVKFEPPVSRALAVRVAAEFLVVGVVVEALLLGERAIPVGAQAVAALWVAATITAWSGWFERKTWALPLELARAPLPFVALWLAGGAR